MNVSLSEFDYHVVSQEINEHIFARFPPPLSNLKTPKTHPKSRNTRKHRNYTSFFEKFARREPGTQWKLFRKTCSDELLFFGWIFRVDFLL